MQTITIIGAGAAGLMTAATILEQAEGSDFHIQIFEKNTSPGKKVILSGGGRCNVTTGIEDKKILLSKYTRGADFIKKAFGKFSPRKCREWFKSHGVPLKCEADNRVFPVSDDGTEIVEVFEHIFAKYRNKVTLHYGEGVSVIARSESVSVMNDVAIQVPEKSEYRLLRTPRVLPTLREGASSQGQIQEKQKYQITTSKGTYESDIVVVTTGGNAYSHTGSTGDGYAFARSLGHTITQLGPSLSSFLTREKWTHELSGLALPSAKISMLRHCEVGSSLASETGSLHTSGWQEQGILSGPLLLTHFGISGPLAFMVSSALAWETIGSVPPGEGGIKGGSVSKTIQISPIANMGYNEWGTFLKAQFADHPKKLIISILTEHLPRRFAEGFVREYFAHIETTYPVSISKVDREKISRLLGEGIPLTLIERRPGDEFVTAGGVSTDEIDPETMESKLQKNLYFAGEVLNVDGYTGGFSLQICWASGHVAGKSISSRF